MTNISTGPKRVLFVDDHPLVLSSLSEMLRARGCDVVTAKRLDDAEKLIRDSDTFDLVLLDINLGKDNGLTLLESPPPNMAKRVVMLSGVTEQEWVLHGFALGAFGFIPKSIELEEVMIALSALSNKPALPNSGWVWDSEARDLVEASDFFPRHSVLTPKERDVFMLLRDGKLDKQIADDLGLSIHTIRVHIRAIKRKRGHNRRFEQNF